MTKRKKRVRGSGEIYKPKGKAWMVRWMEGGRRRSKGGFESREVAERVLAKIQGDLALGRAGLPPDVRLIPTLGHLALDWLDRRVLTHKTAKEDRYRWDKHLKPMFGFLRPHEVDHAAIRKFAEKKLAEGLASGTVRLMVALLSSLFVDLVERGLATTNPGRGLPRSLARLIKPSHDPKTTPFLERMDDVLSVYLKLAEPLNIAFALGALAGLRPGEAFALRWAHVDLNSRRIHLRESVTGSLKDKDSRVVPILNVLAPLLAEWKLKTGGTGLLCPPLRCDGRKIDKGTRGKAMREALAELGLERKGLGWYEATRHTFASQWVMAGGSIEKLKEILGHYSVVMTEKYAHLRPELFTPDDHAVLGQGLVLRGTVETLRASGVVPVSHPLQTDPQPVSAITSKMPEPPCKPGSKHCRYGSRSRATGRDKGAGILGVVRLVATGHAARAPSYGRLRQTLLPDSEVLDPGLTLPSCSKLATAASRSS